MSLAQWGPQVVEVTPGGGDTTSSARRPMQVACRATAAPTHPASAAATAAASPGAPAHTGAMLAARVTRQQMLEEHAQSTPIFARALTAVGMHDSNDDAFWRPTSTAGEFGLLEAFVRKADTAAHNAAANTTDGLENFVLVYSRPPEELRRNFSNHRGERVDLTLPHFQVSRSTLALQELEALQDDAAVRGRDVKEGLRAQLPRMSEDAFFLVAYRDYSDFAVRHFSGDTHRARLGSARFVERHFAVRVGTAAGVFIPVTPAQFQRGWELLTLRDLNAGPVHPSAQQTDAAGNPTVGSTIMRWALSTDQFRGLGPTPRDVREQARFDTQSFRAEQAAAATTAQQPAATGAAVAPMPTVWYKPGQPTPSAWDITPAAMQWRLQRMLEEQYRAVGRLVVKGVVLGATLYVAVYAFRQATGLNHPEHARGASGRRGSSSRRYADDRSVAQAFVDAAVNLNPASFVSFVVQGSSD